MVNLIKGKVQENNVRFIWLLLTEPVLEVIYDTLLVMMLDYIRGYMFQHLADNVNDLHDVNDLDISLSQNAFCRRFSTVFPCLDSSSVR